jgi:phage terminase large subunit-like protein
VDLSDWIEQGYIIEHPDRIDYDDVYNRLLTFFKNYNVQCVGYDPFSAHELQAKLKGNLELSHIPIVPVPQSMSVMSPPSKYFEYLVLNKKIELGQNPVLRYCNANARLKFSKTSNLIRISKDDQLNPIDSIISTVVALAVYMNQEYNEINFMDE